MKYCLHCGKELVDEAVVCPNCETAQDQKQPSTQSASQKKLKKKTIIISAACIVGLVFLVVAGVFINNLIRTNRVKNQLAGETFYYAESSRYSYSHCSFKFDADAQCEYSYYYSNVMDEPTTYSCSYKIKFKEGMIFLVTSSKTYEIQYDKYGNINSLYDINNKELYE